MRRDSDGGGGGGGGSREATMGRGRGGIYETHNGWNLMKTADDDANTTLYSARGIIAAVV